MPVYLIEVRGDPKKRLVKADTDSQARKHVVTAKALTAEQLSDHIDAGLTIEKAEAPTPTPTALKVGDVVTFTGEGDNPLGDQPGTINAITDGVADVHQFDGDDLLGKHQVPVANLVIAPPVEAAGAK